MKIGLAALSFAILVSASASHAAERGQEDARLVLAAEEISASSMDEDEKIERLTEIRSRVIALRKRTASVEAPQTKIAESPRPVSTFVREQVREALKPTPGIPDEERGPPPAFRMGYWISRIAGWTLALGISAAFLLMGYVRFLELCENSGRGDLASLAFRLRLKSPWLRKRRHRPPPADRGIARDGMVPERLR